MLKKAKGLIVVISAPAGAGKTTLCKRLLQISSSFISSVSFTTRPPRKNEIEGVDYYFVSREEFEKLIEKETFLEWAQVHGHLYGTSADFLKKNIEAGKDVVLEVDVKGGKKIKEKYPNSILIFILPPSWEELERRLKGRATEDEKSIKERLSNAKKEIKFLPYYDYFIVNDDINVAVRELVAIIEAERCRISRIPQQQLSSITTFKQKGDNH
ncbi:guanylate kinase [Candidatus Aerophobetes bacterium]|uniref:Guanylate kinase n=1 Tax=Aerophobetes bacterium TaxID=2030807 RepID=A0A662D6V4_UNCAE|nr:MAG: guanylate kinase [Candidatus Aerophobetes bacterium]